MFLYEITHRYLKNTYQIFDTLKRMVKLDEIVKLEEIVIYY